MRFRIAALALLLTAALTACDDPFGGQDPLISADTLTLAAPPTDSIAYGSAIDLLAGNLVRFPERIGDAVPEPNWDVVVRRGDGQLLLFPLPTSAQRRGARISTPRNVQFAEADRAPDSSDDYGTTSVALQLGRVYFARSRTYVQFGGSCVNYAKIQPLALNPATGIVRLAVTSNGRCNDRRLED